MSRRKGHLGWMEALSAKTDIIKLALLIDGDNVQASLMPEVMRLAESLGTPAIRRIYGQFTGGKMKSWAKRITDFDLTKVDVTPARAGKNATDIRLAIEAVDILNGRGIDGVCIASSDSDFTPLADRIRASAVSAYGFGEKKAPKAYKDAFDQFFELNAEGPKAPRKAATAVSEAKPTGQRRAAKPRQPKSVQPKSVQPKPVSAKPVPPKTTPATTAPPKDERLERVILEAIDKTKQPDGWSHLGAVGHHVKAAMPNFTTRGHGGLSGLIAKMNGVERRTVNQIVYVRRI